MYYYISFKTKKKLEYDYLSVEIKVISCLASCMEINKNKMGKYAFFKYLFAT